MAEPTQDERKRQEQTALEENKKGLFNNGNPEFKNAKEKLYDKLPFTVRQLDVFIAVCLAAIVIVIFLGILR